MDDLQVLCFDCEGLDPSEVVGDEAEALGIAHEHADSTGHRLVVQRWCRGRATQLWSVQPDRALETSH